MAAGKASLKADFIDEEEINYLLTKAKGVDPRSVRDIISKARESKGLTPYETAVLLETEDPELVHLMFEAAREVKLKIYGKGSSFSLLFT